MATYTIDDNNLLNYGLQVKEMVGFYTTPQRKAPTEIDNPVLAGVVALTGDNDFYVKEREVEIQCYMLVANVAEALTKRDALQTLLYSPGLRTVKVSYNTVQTWVCYCRDGVDFNRLTGVEGSQVAYEVTIKLVEINPRRSL